MGQHVRRQGEVTAAPMMWQGGCDLAVLQAPGAQLVWSAGGGGAGEAPASCLRHMWVWAKRLGAYLQQLEHCCANAGVGQAAVRHQLDPPLQRAQQAAVNEVRMYLQGTHPCQAG